MAFPYSRTSDTVSDIFHKFGEEYIMFQYLGTDSYPCLIPSPFREDRHPSFWINFFDGRIFWKDLATGEHGNLYDFLRKMWGQSLRDRLNDLLQPGNVPRISFTGGYRHTIRRQKEKPVLEVRTREWRDYDLEYWNSYGISRWWLDFAEVYPVSHIIWKRGENQSAWPADRLAYTFVERKEGRVTIKIYQPFSKKCKWLSSYDSSVISLWTKLPNGGEKVVICSSLKDSLCLWANLSVPAVSLQGEGYNISRTAAQQLRQRFHEVYILFDSDPPGIRNGYRLAGQTGFRNIPLPVTEKGKDVSDIYRHYGKEYLCNLLKPLIFNYEQTRNVQCDQA